MKPLLVLIITFVVASVAIWMSPGGPDHALAGRIAMSVMLLFTAMGHFKFRDGMSRMLPAFIPGARSIVTATGVMEIAGAIGLHIPSLRELTGWLVILFFILILPANIFAALRRLNYETGAHDGPGPRYLWFRIPMQAMLIGWVYLCAIISP